MNLNVYVGRICTDLEVKTTQSGIDVCSFRIAVRRPHSKETTDFIPCTAFRNTASFLARYFKKGQMIGITGYLTSRNYEDSNGNKRTAYEVIANEVEFIGSKADNNTNAAAPGNDSAAFENFAANAAAMGVDVEYTEVEGSDDLPF